MPKPTAATRRLEVLWWLQERPEHGGLTAREIADVSGIYDPVWHGSADRCFDDLIALAGYVRREGRPARWFATTVPVSSAVEGEG
jgi:hypothetical protein